MKPRAPPPSHAAVELHHFNDTTTVPLHVPTGSDSDSAMSDTWRAPSAASSRRRRAPSPSTARLHGNLHAPLVYASPAMYLSRLPGIGPKIARMTAAWTWARVVAGVAVVATVIALAIVLPVTLGTARINDPVGGGDARAVPPPPDAKEPVYATLLRMQGVDPRAAALTTTADDRAAAVQTSLWTQYLPPLLVPRIPGTPTHAVARAHLVTHLEGAGYHVEIDEFNATTPLGIKPMANIIATWDVTAPNRLILAAHYDSKYMRGQTFIGATDSAAPCAILLDVAKTVAPGLNATKGSDTTLQLVFFDGEEAWVDWSNTDSIYGARHLASRWAVARAPGSRDRSMLDSITTLVLLDLLGARTSAIRNLQRSTTTQFQSLVNVERDLHARRFLTARATQKYFDATELRVHVEDDHLPFWQAGVKVVHAIAVPFPDVWHTVADNGEALDPVVVVDLARVFGAFVVDELRLRAPPRT
ncbi:hypothetical protein AMAG_09259 [Allomyces macrogynus ATCC 38327]|uniref:Peptide hydrolase n=1 Tax=Allomyces macrogynus (strain ATCC 38327) TaxID=578462 RepID=A0A0L0SNW8_ALLM3|nr:hypothetical protein AMAG_09259 [Allomyces macrogynus ATCC 38327]|eukprot:KNE64216.1 hypothetical protein AMAG_09259 [Allomyces macrogynus ATCC 38327]